MRDPSTAPAEAPEPADAPAPPADLAAPSESAGGEPRGLAPALLLVLLLIVTWVVGPTIAQLGAPGPDERFYLNYAQLLAEHGPSVLRGLFHDYVADSGRWLFPNPLRVGYFAVAALWVKADGASLQSLAHLSLVSHLLALVVAFRLLARHVGPHFGSIRALFATTLLGFSPLWLGMSRRALQDSFVTLASLFVVSTFFAAIEKPASRRRLALFAAALAFAILAKESLVLLVPPLVVFAALDRGPGQRARLFGLSTAIAAALGAAFVVWWLAAGNLETVRRLAEIVVRSPSTNVYAIRYGGGPWYRYLVDLVSLSAWPTLFGLGGLALVVERARRGEAERLHLLLALLFVLTLAEYAFFTKNLRYVMLLDLPLRVFAVEAIWALLPARSTAARVGSCAVVVALLAVADVRSFRELFLERGLYDPVSAPILTLRGFVPER